MSLLQWWQYAGTLSRDLWAVWWSLCSQLLSIPSGRRIFVIPKTIFSNAKAIFWKPVFAEHILDKERATLPWQCLHGFRPSISLLGEVGKSGYRSVVSYSQAKRTTIPIVRFDSPVIFTNVELLKSYVRRVVENETGNVLIWLCGRFFNSTSLCICHKENMRTQTAHAFGQFMGLSRAKLILIKFIDVRSTSTSVCK